MEILKSQEKAQKATYEEVLSAYSDRSMLTCASRCLSRFAVPKVTINEERCMANCVTLKNHFFFDNAMVLNEYNGVSESEKHEH